MSDLKTVGVKEFKVAIGASTIDILVNPNTNKIFASASNGKTYRVEQAIDVTKAIVVLVPNNAETGEEFDYDNACIVNKRETEVKITL